MKNTLLPGALFLLGGAVAFLHYRGITYDLYWALWWYDLLVHFLGGMWVALFFVWIVQWLGMSVTRTSAMFLIGIGATIVVGFAWEMFELATGMVEIAYWRDTLIDLVMDVSGALLGCMYGSVLVRPHSEVVS
jgi:hypothetical protein